MNLIQEQVSTKESNSLLFFVNGRKVVDKCIDPEWTLLFYLRKKLRLTGTKLGCGEGGCGACTVMLSKLDPHSQTIRHFSVNACLVPVCSVHGCSVTTVEGIGSTKTSLHPVQERIARSHGSQCGFCTPGIVMSVYSLLRNEAKPAVADIETCLQGNLCRCTGYRPILDAVNGLARDACRGCPSFKSCNGVNGNGLKHTGGGETLKSGKFLNNNSASGDTEEELSEGDEEDGEMGHGETRSISLTEENGLLPDYEPSNEPPFPPELISQSNDLSTAVEFHGTRVSWYRISHLTRLLELKQKHPSARIVNGNTEIGVEVRNKRIPYKVLLCADLVPELFQVSADGDGLVVGASLTLSQLQLTLTESVRSLPAWKTGLFNALLEMLHWFAGVQIRNTASIGGNIMTGSPISDLIPLLSACNSQLTLISARGGLRTLPIRGFYTSYRNNLAQPDEVLLSITLPYTSQSQFFMGFKQALRREDDISIVNAGMMVQFGDRNLDTVTAMAICYGGMAATAVHATNTEKSIVGRSWDDKILSEAPSLLLQDLPLSDSAPGGMIQYRRTLTLSFFLRFFTKVTDWLKTGDHENSDHFHWSDQQQEHRGATAHCQLFQTVSGSQPPSDLVGRPVTHLSARKQVCGEALYCDDLTPACGELYAGLVLSDRAHAEILSIDAENALRMPGVVAFYSAESISADKNQFGVVPTVQDEQVFRSNRVTCMGQLVGLVLAEDQQTAQTAARAIKVAYSDLPCVITIEDAIREGSFHGECEVIEYGDAPAVIRNSSCTVVNGSFRIGAQEHFYLETLACIAIPAEDGGVEVVSSNQGLTFSQMTIARVLGVPANRVVCRAKRLGGGFGGKETRATWLDVAVAFAATKSGRPVRIMLDRDEDMSSTGQRHAFLGCYQAAVDPTSGELLAVTMSIYSNGGSSLDLSSGVMNRALTHCDNAYRFPAYRIEGTICRTNIPPSTAFRGFGGTQGCAIAEALMNDISIQLNLPPEQVRGVNLYNGSDVSLTRQSLAGCTARECWQRCLRYSQYNKRLRQVQTFNRKNKWIKRGIAILPNKYGIGFGAQFLNQGGALVHIYTDGSVLVTTGGVEIGQGLHTKCCQIVTRVLGVSLHCVYISETATDKVANTSPTAASMSTDLYGAAVQSACEILWERLEPFRNSAPNETFRNWVMSAYMAKVPLTAHGFHASSSLKYDTKTRIGELYNYFVYGACCSVVEVDCLTGSHKVLHSDIVMDIGRSINPAIDIGQIEGAFMQGYGLFCMERLKYSTKGFNYTRGPGAYKIPAFGDIPRRLRVTILPGCGNPRAVYSSKAVGEPPLFSGASVFFAIRYAIEAARLQNLTVTDSGTARCFELRAPATPDRVRMACKDWLTEQVSFRDKNEAFIPWTVDP